MRILVASLLLGNLLGAAELLVSPAELKAELKNPKLMLLHVGSAQDYAAGHLPGAQLVTLADLSVPGENGLRLQLPPVETLREKLLQMGIGDGSKVVIYAGNESVQSATRIWFTFDYLSLAARMLNGGLTAWKAAGYETSVEKPVITAATSLTVKARPELVVDAAWVSAHLKDQSLAIVDARLEEFYTGKNAGNMPRAGRIPGAVNVPFPTLLGTSKEFLAPGEIRAKLGAKPVVAYCHIGMQATVVYFSAKLAGQDVKLYDGSYEDWSRRTELPVEPQQ
jgi:thiosulfate/3-mercaptopyruvate sulfurtransferase